MAAYIESLQSLAEHFAKMEGVGRKSAYRMAFSVLDMSNEDATAFANAILDAKANIHLCPVCQNLTDRGPSRPSKRCGNTGDSTMSCTA